jgi:L-ascorbate metabolism protein UlaG (beta-lactamase superfamily)
MIAGRTPGVDDCPVRRSSRLVALAAHANKPVWREGVALTCWCLCLSMAAATVGLEASSISGTADLRYLQNSGWFVKTAEHALVFDYVEALGPGELLLADLRLKPEDFSGRRTLVFVSHSHGDHFWPGIAEWARVRPDIQYLVGWPAANLPGARFLKPHERWSSDGVVVETTGSTDEGVGFLVKVAGLTIYHAGDLARWSPAADEAFQAEIRWLANAGGRIDLAFFPIATGGRCEPRPSIWHGVRSAARELQPRVLIPMHVHCLDKLGLYERFRVEISGEPGAPVVAAPGRCGQWFHYEAGKITVVE